MAAHVYLSKEILRGFDSYKVMYLVFICDIYNEGTVSKAIECISFFLFLQEVTIRTTGWTLRRVVFVVVVVVGYGLLIEFRFGFFKMSKCTSLSYVEEHLHVLSAFNPFAMTFTCLHDFSTVTK